MGPIRRVVPSSREWRRIWRTARNLVLARDNHMTESKQAIYTFEIVVDEALLNDTAKAMIPNLIREFALHARVKMALLASTHAVQMTCVVAEHPDYTEKQFELFAEDAMASNPER